MPESTKGTIVVTGASRGIGAAISAVLAHAGYNVACLSRSGEMPANSNLAADAQSRMVALKCDITDSAAVESALAFAHAHFGVPLIGLVNNAGIHLQGPSATFALHDFERVMQTNATAVMLASQAAYPHLRDAGSALIINIGSFYDKLGVRGNAAYCASKAAVAAITRCLAVEWARDGIQVVNIAPGYIETDLNREELGKGSLKEFLKKRIPTGGPGQSDDIAQLATLLFQLPGRFLTGETIYIDGGQGMAL